MAAPKPSPAMPAPAEKRGLEKSEDMPPPRPAVVAIGSDSGAAEDAALLLLSEGTLAVAPLCGTAVCGSCVADDAASCVSGALLVVMELFALMFASEQRVAACAASHLCSESDWMRSTVQRTVTVQPL